MTLIPKTRGQHVTRGRVIFRQGFILIPEFSATGGVKYAREQVREEVNGAGLEAELRTVKTVDNVQVLKESKSILNHAHYILSKYATHTPIGWFVDSDALAKIEAAIGELRTAARTLNSVAASANSTRRVTVEVYPLILDLEHEAAARRLARTVRERLEALRAALLACDREAFEEAWGTCRNLERLATGIQSEAVRLALEHAKQQKTEILQALRDASNTPEEISRFVVVEPLDAAIHLFSEPDQPPQETAARA